MRAGGVEIKTESVYYDAEGKLCIAVETVDAMDELLFQPNSLYLLAELQKRASETHLRVHLLHQIGIDPQFLYDFGEKFGRRV